MFKIGPSVHPPAGAGAGAGAAAAPVVEGGPVGAVQLFRWRGADDYFMITGDRYIAMGGGSAYAWQVDSDFRYGTTGPCSTFESPTLSSTRSFTLNEMEVWAPLRDYEFE